MSNANSHPVINSNFPAVGAWTIEAANDPDIDCRRVLENLIANANERLETDLTWAGDLSEATCADAVAGTQQLYHILLRRFDYLQAANNLLIDIYNAQVQPGCAAAADVAPADDVGGVDLAAEAIAAVEVPTHGAPVAVGNVLDHPQVLHHLTEHLEDHRNEEGRIVDDDGYAATGYIVASRFSCQCQ